MADEKGDGCSAVVMHGLGQIRGGRTEFGDGSVRQKQSTKVPCGSSGAQEKRVGWCQDGGTTAESIHGGMST